MKKYLTLLMIFALCGCSFNNKKNYIEKTMNINLNSCTIKEEKDTHGGFLGDGEYFAKVECKGFEVTNNFKKLPLSSYIDDLMNMELCDSNKCHNAFDRYKIPKLESGYYYFVDRKSDSETSSNFSLAIYDDKNKILYYYELDT